MNRLLVTGSRDWTDKALIRTTMSHFVELCDIHAVVHGDCPIGADAIADALARELGLVVYKYPADWTKQGLKAGPLRNRHMVEDGAVLCLAYPMPWSKGAVDCSARAAAAGIPTLTYEGKR